MESTLCMRCSEVGQRQCWPQMSDLASDGRFRTMRSNPIAFAVSKTYRHSEERMYSVLHGILSSRDGRAGPPGALPPDVNVMALPIEAGRRSEKV